MCLTFETASEVDLLKCGAAVYAQSLETQILCLGFKAVEDRRPANTVVLDGKDLRNPKTSTHPKVRELLALALDPGVIFVAHNSSFEQFIWRYCLEPFGWPPLPIERWHDTLAVAAMKSLPMGLDPLGKVLDLPIQKDLEGHRLMLQLCKPDKDGGWSHHTPEKLARLRQYNVGDVDSQYGAHLVLGPLAQERKNWILDQKINQRGILIDRGFVKACQNVLEQVRTPMTERFKELTGGIAPTQREKILNWVNDQGTPLGDMKKATLDAVLDPDDNIGIEEFSEPMPSEVYEVLNLRRSLASSSVAKLDRMLRCSAIDGRVRYSMQYHGAGTGRASGRLIQIQNYPRGSITEKQGLTPEYLAELIETLDIERIQAVWGPDIFDAVISSLRSCIIPGKGRILVAGDYANVECRIALAFAGQHDKTALMHSGVDVYSEMASMIYHRPVNKKDQPELRHIGKNAVLGLQFGLGAVGFRAKMAPKETVEFCQHTVTTYRKQFAPLLPKFWYGLFEASADAVWCNQGRTYSYAGIEFVKRNGFLTMRLPSNRCIYYPLPKPEKGYNPVTGQETKSWTYMAYQGKKSRRVDAWYGMLMNNLVQGTARDLMFDAAHKAEAAGLPIVFTVHDELVCEPKREEGLARKLKQIMEDLPDWAIERKFLITAEVDEMERYRKG